MNADMNQVFMIFHKSLLGEGRKICLIFQPYRNIESVCQNIYNGKICQMIIRSKSDLIPADGSMDADTNSHDTKRSSGKKTNLILNDLQQEIDCGVPFQRTVILMKPAVLSKQITDHQHGAFHAEIEVDNITILSTEL